jgi:hypothetical protein
MQHSEVGFARAIPDVFLPTVSGQASIMTGET